MSRVIEWIKNHKGLSIALAAGIVILLYLRSRAPSAAAAQAGATVGNTGLSEQGVLALNSSELSAATAIQGQQIGATVATQQLTDELQAKQIDAATQLAIAQLQAGAQNNTIYAQTQVTEQQTTAQEDVALATIQANQQTNADQFSLEQALINVVAGKNNVLNPAPTTPVTPVITSSYPQQVAPIIDLGPLTAPNAAPAPAQPTNSPIVVHGSSGQFLGTYTPQSQVPQPFTGMPSGYSEIPGVNYNFPGQPYSPDYNFPDVEAAVAAGAGVISPVTGHFVPNPGLQVSY